MTVPEDPQLRELLTSAANATSAPVGLADRLLEAARTQTPSARPPVRRFIAPLLAAAAVIALAVGVVVIANGGHRTPANTVTTPPAPPAPSVPGFSVTSLYFVDGQHGWALGDGPCASGTKKNCAMLVATTDGGASWSRLAVPAGVVSTKDSGSCGDNGDSSGPCVDHVVFANRQVGYAWSYRESYLTTDGGHTWTPLTGQQVEQVAIIGDTALRLRTVHSCSSPCEFELDEAPVGTNSWHVVTPGPAHPSNGTEIVAGDGRAYYLSGGFVFDKSGNPVVAQQRLYTSTEGKAWTLVQPSVCGGVEVFQQVSVGPSGVVALTCENEQETAATVEVSTDHGKTFSSPVPLPADGDAALDPTVTALSATRLIAPLDVNEGATYLSANGGMTWTIVDRTTQTDTKTLLAQFVSSTQGFRPGADGAFVSITTDGGATWHHVTP